MAKKPKPKPQPEPVKSFDEFVDDADPSDEEAVNVDPDSVAAVVKARDWRDVERYKEMRELRKLVDDDLDLDDLLNDRPRRRR